MAADALTLQVNSVGYRADAPLPGPADVAGALRQRALEALEGWNEQFGAMYHQVGSSTSTTMQSAANQPLSWSFSGIGTVPGCQQMAGMLICNVSLRKSWRSRCLQVGLGVNYLKNTLKYQFPEVRAHASFYLMQSLAQRCVRCPEWLCYHCSSSLSWSDHCHIRLPMVLQHDRLDACMIVH